MTRKPKLAPRNPFVAASLFKNAGTHDKPHKAQRRADKVALQEAGRMVRHRTFNPGYDGFDSLASYHPRLQTHGAARAACQSFAVSIPR